MTHEDAGHYAAKHEPGVKADSKIVDAIKEKMSDGKITCAAMHGIAKMLSVSPAEVGKTADLLEVRLLKCQLGLFGYSPERKIVKPAENVSSEISRAIRESIENQRISCLSCWEIAEKSGCGKMDISAACEELGVKISPCQLGAF
ncbi:MAG: hypothetical protein JRF40_11575 [Deltaproteobacteria bacterium]|nr:hypothetical protein [Deltaproteobacteria bacterium]MBW2220115.1 hypothetical protein [Deltaproteobacteria bacterium]